MEQISKPHVVVIPFPAQGHVMPLMKLSHRLIDYGFKITFITTEATQSKLVEVFPDKGEELASINLVGIPDGLKPGQTPSVLLFSTPETLIEAFEKVVVKIRESEKISCVISDESLGWAIQVAKKFGIPTASFLPSPAGVKAIWANIPQLIERGIIDENGFVQKDEPFFLGPNMMEMKPRHFTWCIDNITMFERFFKSFHKNSKIAQTTDWILSNTSDYLEHESICAVPKLLSIGPLVVDNQLGNFWPKDSTCIKWLNQQDTNSVIYVANGSIASFNQQQLHELALGLELLGRPFLWVVRADMASTLPEGYQERVAHFGKIVSWAPQEEVLAHPSVACFVSHCGWGSVLDGVRVGVPFVTWPAFADHFLGEALITDVWKVGLDVKKNEDAIVTRDELKRKVDQVLEDKEIRANALKVKEMVMIDIGKDGSSTKNLEKFAEEVKKG